MNIQQLLSLSSLSKEDIDKKIKNLTPEEKKKIEEIMNNEQVKKALKENDLKTLISVVKKAYSNTK